MLSGLLLAAVPLAVLAPPLVHGDVHERIARLDALLLDEPDDAALLLKRAELHREDGNWLAAASDLSRAAELHPELKGLDVEAALLAASSGRAPIQLRNPASPYAGPAPVARSVTPLIAPGAGWRYKDNGIAPAATWKQLGFNDNGWLQGPAELGYGDGDEATVVSFGPNPDQKYPTTWFRHVFSGNTPLPTDLSLAMILDDGAVAYLNGVEVARVNLPAGPITSGTYATTGITGPAETTWHWFTIAPSLLHAGQNVLAVEVHQASPTSSDLSFDVALLPQPPPLLVRGPWIQAVSADAATLSWRSLVAADSVVRWGPAPGQLTQSVTVPGARTDHEVRITGLPADRDVYYAIGDSNIVYAGDDADHLFRTAPAPGSNAPLRAWILGDAGEPGPDLLAVRDAFLGWEAQHGSADLLLQLGDNAYPFGTDTEYQVAMFDPLGGVLRRLPVWSTRGNHDRDSGVYEQIYAPPTAGECGGLPSGTEAWYSFDWGDDVHVVCLDSFVSDPRAGGAMAQWLEADLAASDALWTIVIFHHPPYTKSDHDSDDRRDSGGRLVEMRTELVPILERHGVDLVLSGHSHAYERSKLIQGHYGYSWMLQPESVLDGGDGRVVGDGAYRNTTKGLTGTVYMVCGSSSHVSTPVAQTHPVMVQTDFVLGSAVLDVDGDRLDLRFLDDQGAVRDHMTLYTREAPPTLKMDIPRAGAPWALEVHDLRPGAGVWLWGALGPGAAVVPQGVSGLAAPAALVAAGVADPRGRFPLVLMVPAAASGATRMLQPVEELADGSFLFGAAVQVVIQ